MTVFPSDGCRMGTCHAAAGCGLGIGGRIGNGVCATGHCGDGAGLGGRLFAGRGKGPQDCNAAEPKLGGTAFCTGYRFATVEPKQYGGPSMQIDPISGTVKLPKEKGDNKKDATVNEVTKIEQASAKLPQSYPLPFSKPMTNKDAKANPLATPFSNP